MGLELGIPSFKGSAHNSLLTAWLLRSRALDVEPPTMSSTVHAAKPQHNADTGECMITELPVYDDNMVAELSDTDVDDVCTDVDGPTLGEHGADDVTNQGIDFLDSLYIMQSTDGAVHFQPNSVTLAALQRIIHFLRASVHTSMISWPNCGNIIRNSKCS